jgi:dTDP-glucose 4,6-dehydratase
MNIQKINQELGWQPHHTMEQGLLETVAWYLTHADWVSVIRGQDEYQAWLEKNYTRR